MATSWEKFSHRDTRLMARASAVYALYRGPRLIYIGQTVNLRARFTCAYRRRVDLTHAKARPVPPDQLDAVEQRLIRRRRPEKNVTHARPRGPRVQWRREV